MFSGQVNKTTPSRPLPKLTDATLDVEEVILLSYSCSNEDFRSSFTAGVLIEIFASVYGPSISSVSLRNAALANAAYSLHPEPSSALSVEKHTTHVYEQLRTTPCSALDEGDLLVVYLLEMLSILRDRRDEFKSHLHGFASIISELGKSYETTPPVGLLVSG